jgi:lysophospholipase L1-like esterase
LEKLLRKRFEYKGIEVRNHGIGGLETRQTIALLPRDIGVDPPDLAIAHFGYNDLTAMEERRIPEEARRGIAARNLRELVQRIRTASRVRTEVLLVATVPGGDRARINALDFFGLEAEAVAKELRCGFSDAPRAAFREVLERDGPKALFARRPDGRQDVSHPNADGQRIFAEALLKAFESN